MTAEEAQEHLLAARPHINPHLAERPVVREFQAAVDSAENEPNLFPRIEQETSGAGSTPEA